MAIVVLAALLAVACEVAGADENQRLPKIGQVFGSNPSASKAYDQAFRDGLRELGYVEGKNVILLPRYANGDSSRFPALFAELLALEVNVLVITPTAAQAAKAATNAVPIVLPSSGDPVKEGLAESLSHPGRNITGHSANMVDSDSKRLELALEAVPHLKRLGVVMEMRWGLVSIGLLTMLVCGASFAMPLRWRRPSPSMARSTGCSRAARAAAMRR